MSQRTADHLRLFWSGKSGSRSSDVSAKAKLPTPSMMNSHCQPAIPLAPSRLPRTPAAMRPEKAVAIGRPVRKIEMRRASSRRGYQHVSR